jgi:hypothetical protein
LVGTAVAATGRSPSWLRYSPGNIEDARAKADAWNCCSKGAAGAGLTSIAGTVFTFEAAVSARPASPGKSTTRLARSLVHGLAILRGGRRDNDFDCSAAPAQATGHAPAVFRIPRGISKRPLRGTAGPQGGLRNPTFDNSSALTFVPNLQVRLQQLEDVPRI